VRLVLDTAALVAFDRGDRQVAALVEAARRRRDRVVTSSGCVAQAWRGGTRQTILARLLQGVVEKGLDPESSRITGELCGTGPTGDVVDAHLAVMVRDGDVVVTSHVDDICRLLRSRGVSAQVLRC
jgi:hypothetical protein